MSPFSLLPGCQKRHTGLVHAFLLWCGALLQDHPMEHEWMSEIVNQNRSFSLLNQLCPVLYYSNRNLMNMPGLSEAGQQVRDSLPELRSHNVEDRCSVLTAKRQLAQEGWIKKELIQGTLKQRKEWVSIATVLSIGSKQ